MQICARTIVAMGFLVLGVALAAQERTEPPVIWQDRGDIASLDLSSGAGGHRREPGVEFTFVEESNSGTSPKFVIEDEHGVRWKVKLGEEAKAETAAARLLWAVGYLVDEDYYRARIHVSGLPPLGRGREFVTAGDIIAGARLERDTGETESNHWSWYDNPFVGTREFNGLRVMMALINNWDLKEVNNGSSAPEGKGLEFAVTDLGATFGRTGDSFGRSKHVLEDYAESKFIDRVTLTDVDFVMRSRPFFLSAFNIRNYRARLKMEEIVKRVPLADAKWIGARLGRLSRAQISDCFKAAGFSPDETNAYTDAVTRRIAALEALRATTGSATSPPQRQRIAIARAVIRNTPILVLDEPTSGLDAQSEQAVFEALDRVMEGKTCIVIAHHLATILKADVIFVVKDTSLAECGTHDELVAAGGFYAELYKIQFGGQALGQTA